MLALLLFLAAADSAPKPTEEFVQACFERANGQAELDFCSAGKAESDKHELHDAEAVLCFNRELSQMGMNICAAEEFERADKALNEQWVKAKDWTKDDPQSRKSLLASQRAWLKFRDVQCDVMSDQYRGGSIVPLIHGNCLTELTRQRTRQLTQFISEE